LCLVCVVKGDELLRYSFPPPHPFNSARVAKFWDQLERESLGEVIIEPERADDALVRLFHEEGHLEFVRRASSLGYGFLDEGDTPAFHGVLDAAEFAVGSTVACVEGVLSGEYDHGFNPVGGLHHARPDRSAGFCVFNDIGVSIELLRSKGVKRILYVDIDVHHGDGVFYPYEGDPDLFIFDVHEDGRFLYPGSGRASERGKGSAEGTKVNMPLAPGEGDDRIGEVITALEEFAVKARPDFIILQSGADSLQGDPLGGLAFTEAIHSKAAAVLHEVAHEACEGRIVGLGGGGYNVENCANAWVAVVAELITAGTQ
jgi:acetoin utilization protein AcuC